MRFNPYLTFDGRCAEAFAFYAACFGGTITMMMKHGESPMAAHSPPDWQDKVLHAQIEIGGNVLMGSDSPPQHREKPQGFSVSIMMREPEEAERVFARLAEGAEIRMALQKTFWAERFGMLIDRFGTPWMINCEG